jgi:two-component system, OmpR family, sensor kinase
MSTLDQTVRSPPHSLEKWLRLRLILWFSLLWVAGFGVAVLVLQAEIREVLDSGLIETAQGLVALPEAAGDTVVVAPSAQPPGDPDGVVVWQVFDADGRLQMRSHGAPSEPLGAGATWAGTAEPQDRGEWRVVRQLSADARREVFVAESTSHRHEVIWESSRWLLFPLLAVLPLSAFALRRVLRRGFKTLAPVQAALAEATAELRPLALQGLPVELVPLMQSMNVLMERLRITLEAERTSSARAAHELRTPLAAARALAQRIERMATDPALAQQAHAMASQLDRVTARASRMLELARIESGVARQRHTVDLQLLATMLLQEFAEAGAAGRLHLSSDESASMEVQGDIDVLGIALRNLIENALRHAGPTARVTVHVADRFIEVIDDGPGVAARDLARLVRPFERGALAPEGSGLGLAMVDAIARQSGAVLELHSPDSDGRGFRATLRFGLRTGQARRLAATAGHSRGG